MENNQQNEKVFYKDEWHQVTQSRYITTGKTYAMKNVASVSLFTIRPRYVWPIVLLAMGVILGTLGLMVRDYYVDTTGLAMIVGAIIWMIRMKIIYGLRLINNAREAHNFVSEDRTHILPVFNAINEAIAYQG